MQAMLMSHDLRAHTVRVVYRVRMVIGAKLKRVKPLWLRANGCTKHPSYDIDGDPAVGDVHKREYLWRMPLSGRIVAASAHLHGSSYGLTVKQPRCADRTLVDHQPLYGYPNDIVYRAQPVLHEPGPIATGHFLSKTGIPIRKGEFLRVTGLYDATRPHPRVMAISHVYVAVDHERAERLRGDSQATRTSSGRARTAVTRRRRSTSRSTASGSDGNVHEIDRPPGPETVVSELTTRVDLTDERFKPANLSVPLGTRGRVALRRHRAPQRHAGQRSALCRLGELRPGTRATPAP